MHAVWSVPLAHMLPHFGLDVHGSPISTPPFSFYVLTAARGKDSFWFLYHQTLMLVPSRFISLCHLNNIISPSVHGPTHVGLVLPCFFGFLLCVLLWATLLSSIAALHPLPPGLLRREPDWSCQDYQGSAVLRCNDFSFWTCTLEVQDPAFLWGLCHINVWLGPPHHSIQLVSPAHVPWMVLSPLAELVLLLVSPQPIGSRVLCTHSTPKREGLIQAGRRGSASFVVLTTSWASLCLLWRVHGQGMTCAHLPHAI